MHAVGRRRSVADVLRRAGADVELEVWIPELANEKADACMDLVIGWPGLAASALWDVTVRTAATGRPADAASTGVADKLRRYGDDVQAISVGSRGRLHATSRAALEQMAAQSRAWDDAFWGARRV